MDVTEINLDGDQALFRGEINSVVAVCYQNERPLLGLAGALDWRFDGALSRYIRQGIVKGVPGECVYVPFKRRERTYHVFLVGGGHAREPGQRVKLPQKSLDALKKNLLSLQIKKIGISSSEFGNISSKELAQSFKGAAVCLVH